jgi:antitoxin HigA-1
MSRLRTHPGEVLREDFMKPLNLSECALAEATGIPEETIVDIVNERRDVTADIAARLAKFLGPSAHFWSNLQGVYARGQDRD